MPATVQVVWFLMSLHLHEYCQETSLLPQKENRCHPGGPLRLLGTSPSFTWF